LQVMDDVPKPLETDAEDVVWALETASSLYKRGDRVDALVWIRRAAEAAGVANDDERALALARHAATFADKYGKAHAAGEVHGGMFDPWGDTEPATSPKSFRPSNLAPPNPRPSGSFEASEVLTSAPPLRAITSEPRLHAALAVSQSSPPPSMSSPRVDLSGLGEFSDAPDEARALFATNAEIQLLSKDEEFGDFAFALVLEGDVDVSSAVADAAALRLSRSSVIRSRGSLEVRVPLRLVGASDSAKIAVWNEEHLRSAFQDCPWIDEELRRAGDKIQALVGITLGAMGERLDPGMRNHVTSRLEVRVMASGEIFATEGHAIPGLLVVAVGEITLEGPGTAIGSGEFVFAQELLSGDGAPATARAGKDGAIVLVGARQAAQELLMSVPPLLEIFAGM